MSRIWPRLASTLSVTSGNVSPRPFKEMPTEKGNSLLFGIGPQLMKEKNYQFPFYRRLAEKHGKVFRMKVAPGKYLVVLSDPEDVDFVQQNEGKYPNRGSALRVMKLLFSGDLSSPSSMLATR
jgi:cytochrome P450